MNNLWLANAISAFLLSLLLTGVFLSKTLLIAFKRKLFDMPDQRKIHLKAVPRLGGLAFAPAVFFVLSILINLNLASGNRSMLEIATDKLPQLLAGFCATLLLYEAGRVDDLIGIRYRTKFAVQILSAVTLITGGIQVDNFFGILGIHALPVWIAWPFTVLLVVFIVNAVNMIDGIDGLAAGLTGIAFLLYGLVFFVYGEYLYAVLSFATLGTLSAFFYYNMFGDPRHKKKIFMGDAGSLTIGILLCFLAMQLMQCLPQRGGGSLPFVLAAAPLLIPCCDVIRVYIRRLRNHQNPFLPDKNHIHHKLLAIGLTPAKALLTISGASAAAVAGNIAVSARLDINWLIAANAAIWIAANLLLDKGISKRTAARNEPNTQSGQIATQPNPERIK